MKKQFGIVLFLVMSCVIAISGGAKKRMTFSPVTIVHMQEASGTTSYKGETEHVTRISFLMPADSTPGATTGTTGMGATSTATTGGTSTGDGTTYSTISTTYGFAVDHASYVSDSDSAYTRLTNDSNPSFTPGEATIYTSNSGAGFGPTGGIDVEEISASPGDTCTLRIAPTGRTVTVYWVRDEYRSKTVVSGGMSTTTYGDDITGYYSVFPISRTTADAVAIDTRKAFGQPDLGGALPGDANAPAANVKFHGWTYMGGLFAGNADYLSSSDLSGTARTELYAPLSSPGSAVFMTVTLLSLGNPAQFTTMTDLTGYIVSTGPTDLTLVDGSSPWTLGSASLTDVTFGSGSSSTPVNEYANFEFSGVPCTDWVSIACTNEATDISTNISMWEYFADQNYITSLSALSPPPTASMPFSDPLPRFWMAQDSGDTEYAYAIPWDF